jgi:lipopolysaccharide transport system ATP-binding protein
LLIDSQLTMSDVVITVENLSKRYLVGHQTARRERYTALRDVIGREARNFARKAVDLMRGRQVVQGDRVEEFWALRDVSFEVRCGEVLGIIGRNGAGKSTLLKVLSRITEPTKGRVTLRGRVASLLEVGTGFHPELTGRENIFLNGAILGMKQSEIRRKFDEIVAFAEVEKFLDTPVKRYSSGMYVRLAFAVAAHLEPEILVVDEVLAVGDAEFQKKCLGKMSEVARGGRTILFVSHNISAISSLCSTGLLLREGHVLYFGDVDGCIRRYDESKRSLNSSEWIRPATLPIESLGFTRITIVLDGKQPSHVLRISCSFSGERTHKPAIVAFDIRDALGTPLMQALPSVEPFVKVNNSSLEFHFVVKLPPIIPGLYHVTAWMGPHNTETYDVCDDCVSFEIHESPTPGRIFPHTPNHGFLVPASEVVELVE